MNTLLLIVIPVMTAIGFLLTVKYGDRLGKGRLYWLGLCFVVLAIVANSSRLSISPYHVTLSLRDIPVVREIVPENVFDDVAAFADAAEQADDITVLSLNVRSLKDTEQV